MARRNEEVRDIASGLSSIREQAKSVLKEQGSLTNAILGTEKQILEITTAINEEGKVRRDVTNDYVKQVNKSVQENQKLNETIQDTFPGVMNLVKGAEQFGMVLRTLATANPLLALVAGAAALFKVFSEIQEEITNTRKELGVSLSQSVAITAQNKALAQVAKGFGLTIEDITSAQAAIRNDLGASVQESVKLSLSFARTAAATGQSAEDLSTTLSLMESISSASRETLLNQLRSNAAMIEAAGVAPALVMRDIAQNAEFFASFARDGGQNLIQAGTAARKLGLDLGAVASISESLLDFESSIEKSLEASVLLGRQINTDRARQLAFAGDQKGLLEEIQRLVGGEAEFEALNFAQRRALAGAVGTSVEQLSRLVRNNTATGTTAAIAGGGDDSVFNAIAGQTPIFESIEKNTRALRD